MQIVNVVIDCLDPDRLSPFWEAATGRQRTWSNGEFVVLSADSPGQPLLLLQRVPEAKIGKNRCHLDLGAPELEAEVERLIGLGARRGETHDLGFVRWTVMADPDGNEFCLSSAHSATT